MKISVYVLVASNNIFYSQFILQYSPQFRFDSDKNDPAYIVDMINLISP